MRTTAPAPAVRRWLVGMVAGATMVGCALPGSGADSVTVSALWADDQGGSRSVGVSPVEVTVAEGAPGQDFAVDLAALRASGAETAWTASAWTAATVAMLYAGEDPRGRTVGYEADRVINEPSASALLAAGTLAGLTGAGLDGETSMIGTIMPNGAVGAVPRIPELMQAASEGGISTVLIPDGVSREPHEDRDDPVDLRSFGQSLGLRVVPVATITEAVAVMGGSPLLVPNTETIEVDPPLVQLLTGQTRRELGVLRRALAGLEQPADADEVRRRRAISAEARATLRSVPRLLLRGDVFVAYSQVTLAVSDLKQYDAEQQTLVSTRTAGVPRTRSLLLRRARQERRETEARIRRAAEQDLRFAEQYPALADALTWGTGNLAIIEGVDADLRRRWSDPDRLAEAASELARVRYRLDTYLPVQLRAVRRIGRTELAAADDQLALLSSFAELLGQCGDAVMAYYDALPTGNAPLQRLVVRLAQQQRLWRATEPDAGSDQAVVLERLAWALSYYVASSFLFTLGPLLTPADVREQAVLLNPGYFSDQVNVATDQNQRNAERVAAAGLDPSYVVWGNEWGLALADQGAGVAVPDEIRARGLSYQWYAAVQGSMLSAYGTTVEERR